MPQAYPLNTDWKFSLSDHPRAMEPDFDDCAFAPVTVPHDWNRTFPYTADAPCGSQGGFLHGANVGWYRKWLYLDKARLTGRLWLDFDGVLEDSTVYLNGEKLGFRPYGYFPARYEITGRVQEGANLIAVRADCTAQPFSRWYNGCGIFRQVNLITAPRACIPEEELFVRTLRADARQAVVAVSLRAETDGPAVVRARLRDGDTARAEAALSLKRGGRAELELTVQTPRLWGPDTPFLYRLELELEQNGRIADSWSQPFGIRMLTFAPGEGMFLNGMPLKMKGVCLHHDAGVVGAAVPPEMLRRRLQLLREMGCNALRTAHNPFSRTFYDLCDELGFLVVNEAFDGWETAKAPCDYGRWFADWHRRDLETFVRRDRNHPCVAMWSIGNEVVNGTPETARRLQDLVHSLDDTRPVTCGVQGTGPRSDACRAVLDIAGYNDGGGACFIYERDHARRPGQLMLATESPHTLHTRGFYRTRTWWRDKNQPRREIPNLTREELFTDGGEFYHSSYDNAGVRLNARDCWEQTRRLPWLIGEFRWIGIDYYGESLRWPAHSADSGVIDTAGLCKDHYYLYQAMWTDPEQKPMVHLLPHWTHTLPRGRGVPVFAYTNGQAVELLLNGRSLGTQPVRQDCWASWTVPWEPGVLTARALYGGRCIAETSRVTAGAPAAVTLERLGPSVPLAEGETGEWQLTVRDEAGVEVPDARCPALFFGEGMDILGTENGDPVDLTPRSSRTRCTFYGSCTVVARALSVRCPRYIGAVALLGRRWFDGRMPVTVAKTELFPAELSLPPLNFRYRIDDGPWQDYSAPFWLEQTARVTIQIRQGERWVGELSARFCRGKAPVYLDRAHGNEEIQSELPPGPFSDKLFGRWRLAGGETVFRFDEDGTVCLETGDGPGQKLGGWWYDFPVDWLEAQDYAGTGEIWFSSGERQPIRLLSQAADRLEMDNRQFAFSTEFSREERIELEKMEDAYETP